MRKPWIADRVLDETVKKLTDYNGKEIYHGGVYVVTDIDLNKSKSGSDFGVAFYMTTSKSQAESWALSKYKRSNAKEKQAIVNVYEISTFDDLNCLIFSEANEDWLDFIVENRINYSRINTHKYDVVIGPVADDDTQVVIENYIAGLYEHYGHLAKEMAMKFLEPWKLKNQVALCTQAAVDRVKYISHYNLQRG